VIIVGRTDLKSGLILAAISIVSIGYALSLPQGITKMGVLQPGVFPLFISLGLLLCSLILALQGYKGAKEQDMVAQQFNLKGFLQNKSFLLIVGIFLYFTVVIFLGFLISTLIAVFISVHFIFKHKLFQSVCITLILSFGTYFVFQSFLNINLPKGMFSAGFIL
jgi:putative tricarboxylic transport membrane protein